MKHLAFTWLPCWLLVLFLAKGGLLGAQVLPYLSAASPEDKADQVRCNTLVALRLYFPGEGKALDPGTVQPPAVRLFPAEKPQRAVAFSVRYDPDRPFVYLQPREPLAPETIYQLETSPALADVQGQSFRPFRMSFRTGECGQAGIAVSAQDKSPTDSAEVRSRTPYLALRYFGAWLKDSLLDLRWKTDYEQLNAGFFVEQAPDGKPYVFLAEEPSHGDGEKEQFYQYLGPKPEPGLTYFRLGQVNVLGDTVFLDTAAVFRPQMELLKETLRVGETLPVAFVLAQPTPMVLVLQSSQGKFVKRKATMVPAGRKVIEVSLEDVPPGNYVVILRTTEDRLVRHISVMR